MSRVVALISALLALGLASFVAPSAAQATGNPNLVIWGYDIWRSDIGAYSHGLIGFKTSNIDHFVNGEQSCNGDRDEFPPTAHGFHAFLYHLYARGEPELPNHRKDPAYSAKFGPRRSTMPSERDALQGWLRDDSAFGVVLKLIQEAGNPYFDWLFGSSERSAGVLASWARRSSSEVSTEQVTVAISGGELVGMFIGLSGSAVQRSRKADAFALFGEVGNDPAQRSALLQKLTKNLFVAVESSEYYLSKIGVVPACRGRGFGKALMSEFLAAGRRSGFYRFRLDVSADNERAIRMYRSFGFVIDSCHFAAGMRYLSMTLLDSPPGGTVRLLPSYLAEPVRFERLISASDRQFPT